MTSKTRNKLRVESAYNPTGCTAPKHDLLWRLAKPPPAKLQNTFQKRQNCNLAGGRCETHLTPKVAIRLQGVAKWAPKRYQKHILQEAQKYWQMGLQGHQIVMLYKRR